MTNKRKAALILPMILALIAAGAPKMPRSADDSDLRRDWLLENPVNRMLAEQDNYDMWLFLWRDARS